MRQEDLIQYPQRMFGLPDLPVCDTPAVAQVSQEGLYISSGSRFQRFSGQESGEVPRPVHVEWGTVGSHMILFCARPVRFPKSVGPFHIVDFHDYHRRMLYYVNELRKN